jgi:hypothetical protein
MRAYLCTELRPVVTQINAKSFAYCNGCSHICVREDSHENHDSRMKALRKRGTCFTAQLRTILLRIHYEVLVVSTQSHKHDTSTNKTIDMAFDSSSLQIDAPSNKKQTNFADLPLEL